MTDLARVKKIYKLNAVAGAAKGKGKGGGVVNGNGMVNGEGEEKDERRELEMLVLGAMALRGVTN